MEAFGPCFKSFSGEDVTAIFKLYEATPSVAMAAEAVRVPEALGSVAKQQGSCPPSLNEAGGDEAAGSSAASVKPMPVEKDILSSPEDDLSLDETPCGDGHNTPGELHVNSHIPQWCTLCPWLRKKGDTRKKLYLLTHRFKGMPFGADRVSLPSGPVKTPGPIATEASWTLIGAARAAANLKDNQGDGVTGGGDARGHDARICPHLQCPTHNHQLMAALMRQGEVMSLTMRMRTWRTTTPMSQVQMPPTRMTPKIQTGRDRQVLQGPTPNGKIMDKMFKRCCDLTDHDTNAIVVYFGIYSEACITEFLHDHWNDTFTQWQKRHPN
jgi:hypothetical protein